MRVKVRLLKPYNDVIGKKELVLEIRGTSLGSLLEELSNKYPKLTKEILNSKGELDYSVNAILNDRPLTSEDAGVKLKDGDVVTLFAPISGG